MVGNSNRDSEFSSEKISGAFQRQRSELLGYGGSCGRTMWGYRSGGGGSRFGGGQASENWRYLTVRLCIVMVGVSVPPRGRSDEASRVWSAGRGCAGTAGAGDDDADHVREAAVRFDHQ